MHDPDSILMHFFALPDWVFGSEMTSRSSFFVTESTTFSPWHVASSVAISLVIVIPRCRHCDSPVKHTRLPTKRP